MNDLDQIRAAIEQASKPSELQADIGDWVFPPINKNGFILRHPTESKEVIERYRKYREKFGIKNTTNFPRKFVTKMGVKVRSKGELIAANALTELGIRYYYEPLMDFGHFFRIPDFYLPDQDIIYEHFGHSSQKYLKNVERKKELFRKYNVRWTSTNAEDEVNIKQALQQKLRKYR